MKQRCRAADLLLIAQLICDAGDAGAAQRKVVADTPPAAILQPDTSNEQALAHLPQETGADASTQHAEETDVDDVAAQQDDKAAEGVQQEPAPHEKAEQAAAETMLLTLDVAAQQPDIDVNVPEEAPAAEESAADKEAANAAAEELLPASEAAAVQLDAAVKAAADTPAADAAPPAHLAAAEAIAAALAAAAAGEAKGEMLPVAAAGAASTDAQVEGEEEEDDVCHVCGEADEGDVLLLCDGCDNACHLGCARPMLRRIPKSEGLS